MRPTSRPRSRRWLLADHDNLTGKVLRLPSATRSTRPVQEQLIVELYSK